MSFAPVTPPKITRGEFSPLPDDQRDRPQKSFEVLGEFHCTADKRDRTTHGSWPIHGAYPLGPPLSASVCYEPSSGGDQRLGWVRSGSTGQSVSWRPRLCDNWGSDR